MISATSFDTGAVLSNKKFGQSKSVLASEASRYFLYAMHVNFACDFRSSLRQHVGRTRRILLEGSWNQIYEVSPILQDLWVGIELQHRRALGVLETP